MITSELLNNNETLSALTDEQKTAIVELSKQDEGIVIGERIGKIYGDLDNDILAASGIEKNGAEKTYAYAKRVIGALKEQGTQVGELQTQVNDLTKAKADLEKAIAEGATDSETKRQLAQAKTDLADITKKYTELNTQYEGMKTKHDEELFGLRVSMQLDSAAGGIKFKSSIPDSVAKVVLADVTSRLKANATTIEEDGAQIVAYKGENGEVLRDNSLKAVKAQDLLYAELEKLGVVDKRKVQTGAGSKEQKPEGGEGLMNLTGAKTQVEADELIHKSLVSRGLVIGTNAYQEARDKAWKDNAITKLPIK